MAYESPGAGQDAEAVARPATRSAGRDSSTKEAILAMALASFARRGFEGTSMSAVARQAGVTQPLMHYYFASKDDLWRAAVAQAYDEMLLQYQMMRDLRDLDALAAIRLLIRQTIDFHRRNPDIAPLVVREQHHHGERLDWLSDTYLAPLEAQLADLIERAAREGSIRGDLPTPYVVRFVVGGVLLIFTTGALMERIHGIDTSDPDVVDTHARVVFDMLFEGLLTRP